MGGIYAWMAGWKDTHFAALMDGVVVSWMAFGV